MSVSRFCDVSLMSRLTCDVAIGPAYEAKVLGKHEDALQITFDAARQNLTVINHSSIVINRRVALGPGVYCKLQKVNTAIGPSLLRFDSKH